MPPTSAPRRPPRTAPIAVLLLVVVASRLVAGTEPAHAHSILVATTPGPGDEVEALVEVRLEFAGEVAADGHTVTADGPGGEHPAATYERPDATTVVARFAEPLPAGQHELVWEVVAGDGHHETGRIPVTVTDGQGGTTTTAPVTTAAPSTAPPTPSTGAAAAPPTTGPSVPAPGGDDDGGDTGEVAGAPAGGSDDGGPGTSWAIAGAGLAVAAIAAAGLAYRRRSPSPSR